MREVFTAADLEVSGYDPRRDEAGVRSNLEYAEMYRPWQDDGLQYFTSRTPNSVIVARFPGVDRVIANMYVPDSPLPVLARYACHELYEGYDLHQEAIIRTVYNAAFNILRNRQVTPKSHVEDLYNRGDPNSWERLGFQRSYDLIGLQRPLWADDLKPYPDVSVPPMPELEIRNYDLDRDGQQVQKNMKNANMYVEGQDHPEIFAHHSQRMPNSVIVARYPNSERVEASMCIPDSPIPLITRYVAHSMYREFPQQSLELRAQMCNRAFQILRERNAPHVEVLNDRGLSARGWQAMGFTKHYDIIGTTRPLWNADGTPYPDLPVNELDHTPYWDKKGLPLAFSPHSAYEQRI
jgi:hypothetical protein